MRTTLTLDPDVAERVERLQAARGTSMKDIINQGLRAGLDRLEHPAPPRRFRTKKVTLKPRGTSVDDVAEVLALAEGDDYR